VSTSPLVYYQVLSIFGLIKEAISKLDIQIDNGVPDKEALITFIHQHIYEPEQIRVKNIAAHFHIAGNYFSAYFKRNFDMSYREYVDNYRAKLIEKRVETGNRTLKEVADEFGFTDESHLSSFFKKKFHISLKLYRQNKNLNQDVV
jgi:AraC-like DNA-binding protein